MVRRVIAALLALFHLGNGAFMLLAPLAWLGFVTSGPAPASFPATHFIYDIGLAFVASGVGLGLFAARPSLWAAGLIGTAFPALHALLHVFGMVQHEHADAFDAALWILPGVIGVIVTWPTGARRQ